MNLIMITAALSGWMTSLYLILILLVKKNDRDIQRVAEANTRDIQRIAEANTAQLEQNNKHIEAITECIEEMNSSWKEQVREFCNR